MASYIDKTPGHAKKSKGEWVEAREGKPRRLTASMASIGRTVSLVALQ